MDMVYTKSEFEMPDGKYLAEFLGVTMRDDPPGSKPRIGQDGKPLPPAMTWDFRIVDGPEKGKRADKLTGRIPTPNSGCGKMLVCISDSVLKEGDRVNLDQFVGKIYRITIKENRVSDNPGPVLERVTQPAPTTAGNGTATSTPVGNPGQTAGDLQARWDLWDEAAKVGKQNVSTNEVQAYIDAGKFAASAVRVKPAGAPREQAKAASDFQFMSGDVIPF